VAVRNTVIQHAPPPEGRAGSLIADDGVQLDIVRDVALTACPQRPLSVSLRRRTAGRAADGHDDAPTANSIIKRPSIRRAAARGGLR
jgi:hypothetical protein